MTGPDQERELIDRLIKVARETSADRLKRESGLDEEFLYSVAATNLVKILSSMTPHRSPEQLLAMENQPLGRQVEDWVNRYVKIIKRMVDEGSKSNQDMVIANFMMAMVFHLIYPLPKK